jgi:hypothetical protein
VLATLAGTIPAGGYHVLASTTYAGTAQTRFVSGISVSTGGIGLRSATAALIDSVAWVSTRISSPCLPIGRPAP